MSIRSIHGAASFVFLLAAVVWPRACHAVDVGPLPLTIVDGRTHHVELRPADAGAIEIRTTGGDPYVLLRPGGDAAIDLAARPVLEFEYFSTNGVRGVEVRLDPVLVPDQPLQAEPLGRSEGWSRRTIDLTPLLDRAGAARGLRLDLGQRANRVMQIRGIRLRAFDESERQARTEREARLREQDRAEVALREYLAKTFPCDVTHVSVDDQRVTIEGKRSGGAEPLFLAAIPVEAATTSAAPDAIVRPIEPTPEGRFKATVDRRVTQERRIHDRLLDRWAVVAKSADGRIELRSHARYADDVTAAGDPPRPTPRGKKGLGALWAGRPLEDLDDLGVSWVTVNIGVSHLIRTTPGPGRTAFEAFGRTWYAEDRTVASLDQTLLEAAKHNLLVSAIILVAQARDTGGAEIGKLLAHPDADPSGIYVMPNLTTRDGAEAYAAVLDFLARRYGRADSKFGRIHHWILHNEIDAGWVWTNAGEKSPLLYMDLYQRSMRMAHLIARQYDPRAKAFISLTHYWATPGERRFYASRELLDLLLGFCRAEGDFDWAIAFHPYPQSLGNPRVWEDNKPTFTFDTPQITFKNIEVLDAWVRQPRVMFLGTQVRTVHLTEQGLNSRDYSPASLRDQAAGMAYAWAKIKDLPTIEAFDYHNWVDNRGEGGLRIGLRRFPDDAEQPLGKKPIWSVYQAAGTGREAEVFEPYKAAIGVKDWAEVRYRGEIK
jgi:hypothetical protein